MPKVCFEYIHLKHSYSRKKLAEMWGYSGYEALARGVVTPSGDNKIILFVTEAKRSQDEQYNDFLGDGILQWDGPNDHFAECRLLAAERTGEEIHLFYRAEHKADFTYFGRLKLESATLHSDSPSRFRFQLISSNG